MSDPKGTYYSPQESGFATVLRPGPNLLGMAQQQQALAAKRDQLAMQRQAKLDDEREKQVGKIVADLSKPVPTAFPYQEEVNKKKAALLQEVQDMFLKNADPSEIRFKTANGVQEMLAYANSGKQVYEGILSQTKQLDQKKYKIDEINKGLADKIIGPEGAVLDPSKVDPRDLSATELVYSSKRPWDYLNQNVVVKDFLKNDKFKETLMEVQRNADAGHIGRFTTFDKTTNITKAVGPLYDVNPISGDVKLNDPETLIENGVYQLAMNDRDMAAVIEGEVQRLTENRLTPLDGKAKDMLAASVLQDLLVGSTPGPTTIERVTRRVAPTSVGGGSSSGRQTQSEIDGKRVWASSEDWWNSLFSDDVTTRADAARFLDEDKLKPLIPNMGKDETIMDVGMAPNGRMTVRTESRAWDASASEYKTTGQTYEVDVTQRKEALFNAYAKTAKGSKRYYGTTEAGRIDNPPKKASKKSADDL